MFRKAYGGTLYLADAMSARDLSLIYDHGIAAVVDLAENEPPAQLGRDIIYCRFPLADDDSNDDQVLSVAIDCVRQLLCRKIRTLIACSAGMSRSPTIAAAALSIHLDQPFESTLQRVLDNAPRDVSPLLLASVARVHEAMCG